MTQFDFKSFKKLYDGEVNKLMRAGKVPGFSVLITKDGDTVYERSYGYREWNGSKPANSDTIYGIASITKSMTAFAILQLHEAEKLNINDPINKYLPIDIGSPDYPILIKHLLSHSSSIPNLGSYETQIKNEDLTEFSSIHLPMGNWEDFYFHINEASDWVTSKPGEKFYYSNDSFTMLSKIVAEVSGLEFEEYLRQNLFEPLNMKRSTFSREDLEEDDNVSKGYSTNVKEEELIRLPRNHLSGPFQSGAGGLNSSVYELTQYLLMHVNNGRYNNRQLLTEELIKEMRKPHNKNNQSENLFFPYRVSNYGFGFAIVDDFYGYTLIFHGGASGVAGGMVAFIPELKITYTHLYNVGWLSTHMMLIALLSLIGQDPLKELPYLKRREHFNNLCGSYHGYKKTISIEIIQNGGQLYLEYSKSKVPIIPVDPEAIEPWEFYIYNEFGRLKIRFSLDKENKLILEYERNLMRKVTYTENLEKLF
jgi:CubicO group peptidase (beta-lactamase class C family)